ncbi:MAG: response regulator [Chloroflexi bacterium]|nr:response regulator [Chloroflexota bacterium]
MRGKPQRKVHHARPKTIRARPQPSEAQASTENGTAAGTPRRKCVLVVEDNATIGGLLVALLREEGYRALRAWDGREAMKMARDRRPDLIVLDLSLPYRDGIEVLHALRGNEDTAEAPMVIVAGNALQLTPDDRALVSDAVAKPFDIDRLMNVFRRHLGDPELDVPERNYEKSDTHLHSW